MVIEMSEEDGINFITKSVKEIREIVDGVDVVRTESTVVNDIPDVKEIGDSSEEIDIITQTKLLPDESETNEPVGTTITETHSDYIAEVNDEERNMQIFILI